MKKIRNRISTFFRSLFRRQRNKPEQFSFDEALREFIYLDPISVYSLLASRKGSITTEFTQSQSQSSRSGLSGSLGFASTTPNLSTSAEVESVKGAHVLSKANIQSHFKELVEIEKKNLKLRPPCVDSPPTPSTMQEIKDDFDRLVNERWIVLPNELQRGNLLEVEVTLEADPIFRVISVISTICELIDSNGQLFGHMDASELSQILSIAQVLESLLAGLVPIRGHLAHYEVACVNDKEVLIHHALLQQLPKGLGINTFPVTLVGVAERDLFWKDIRRILFSKAPYTVFCRLGVSGLTDHWQPIKTTNVLTGIVPDFDKALGDFGKTVTEGFPRDSFATQQSNSIEQESSELEMLANFVSLLAQHHEKPIESNDVDSLIASVSRELNWMETVTSARPVLEKLREKVDLFLEVSTCRQTASDLRLIALRKGSHDVEVGSTVVDGNNRSVLDRETEKYLDTEIVAIYW